MLQSHILFWIFFFILLIDLLMLVLCCLWLGRWCPCLWMINCNPQLSCLCCSLPSMFVINYSCFIFKKVCSKPKITLPNEAIIHNFEVLILITIAYSGSLLWKRLAKMQWFGHCCFWQNDLIIFMPNQTACNSWANSQLSC